MGYLSCLNIFVTAVWFSGFMTAMKSVLTSILYILESLSSIPSGCDSSRPWAVYITGHSLGTADILHQHNSLARLFFSIHFLGGALASLLGLELGLIKANIRRNDRSHVLHDMLRTAEISMYSFGSPRVGNSGFVKVTATVIDIPFILSQDPSG